MQIGFNLPVSGPMATPSVMAQTAQLGEALGFDYLTLTDHIALPDTNTPGYPYSESGSFYSPDPGRRFEQLTAAAWVAAKTNKIRLVLAVLVVPHRPAVLAAKMLATIDVLCEGRLIVGVGAGWLQSEIEAVATTPFADRGAVTDEYIDAFKRIWTEEKPSIDGKYTQIHGLVVEPRPHQRPHPPIWVGGESRPSMRRAARVGDAWYPIGTNQANMLDTLPRLEAGIERLRQLSEAAGRARDAVNVVYRIKRYAYDAPLASDGNRKLFSGTIADTIADLQDLRDLGVGAVDFDFEGRDTERSHAQMREFKDLVLRQV